MGVDRIDADARQVRDVLIALLFSDQLQCFAFYWRKQFIVVFLRLDHVCGGCSLRRAAR